MSAKKKKKKKLAHSETAATLRGNFISSFQEMENKSGYYYGSYDWA